MLGVPSLRCWNGISDPEIQPTPVHNVLDYLLLRPAGLRRSRSQQQNAPGKVTATTQRSLTQQPPGEVVLWAVDHRDNQP